MQEVTFLFCDKKTADCFRLTWLWGHLFIYTFILCIYLYKFILFKQVCYFFYTTLYDMF